MTTMSDLPQYPKSSDLAPHASEYVVRVPTKTRATEIAQFINDAKNTFHPIACGWDAKAHSVVMAVPSDFPNEEEANFSDMVDNDYGWFRENF